MEVIYFQKIKTMSRTQQIKTLDLNESLEYDLSEVDATSIRATCYEVKKKLKRKNKAIVNFKTKVINDELIKVTRTL